VYSKRMLSSSVSRVWRQGGHWATHRRFRDGTTLYPSKDRGAAPRECGDEVPQKVKNCRRMNVEFLTIDDINAEICCLYLQLTPPGSLNRVPAPAKVRAGMSPLLGGR